MVSIPLMSSMIEEDRTALASMVSRFIFSNGFIKAKIITVYIGSANKVMKKRLVFCENKTREIMTTVDTSRKIERRSKPARQ